MSQTCRTQCAVLYDRAQLLDLRSQPLAERLKRRAVHASARHDVVAKVFLIFEQFEQAPAVDIRLHPNACGYGNSLPHTRGV